VLPRDWRLYVQDILDAIAAIQDYTAGMDFPSFQRDRRTLDAVLRNVTVIGEAAGRIPDKIQAAFPEIPWTEMRDMRNIVVHEYFGIDKQILWETTQADLPPLVLLLKELLIQKAY